MYIFGRNPVLEALAAGTRIAKIFFRFGAHGGAVAGVREAARSRNIPWVELPKVKFDRLGTGVHTQGVAALVEEARIMELDELLAYKPEQDPPFLVALDGITDPHNAGAVIRSAECAGAHGVIIPMRDAVPITDTVVKVSAGATEHMRIARVAHLGRTLEELKEHGIWVAGLAADGDTDLFALDGERPLCIVVGAEGGGLRPTIRKACDMLVRIPMWGHIDSLNASVAAALALYEVRRKRL